MAKRKRVGLIFSYNENWIAGAYYILNIIKSLNTLPISEKPRITIISDSISNFNIVKKETNYRYLDFFKFPNPIIKYSLFERIVNKVTLTLFNIKVIQKPKYPTIEFLYPNEYTNLKERLPKTIKKINWIPDFQEEHLPEFFSKEDIISRKHYQREVVCKGDIVVFSSENAKKDFNKLYPTSKTIQFVLNFAVIHPDFSHQNLKVLLNKYNLSDKYFFSPNQFWAHKNHLIILKSVKYLKDKGVSVTVAFSGKESDYRNVEHFKLLEEYIIDNNIKENINFLGFISREEQLCLLNSSIAIVQPSLFEGWSTVVEDAKALNKFLILSDLNVHKEQINQNVHFFNPKNHEELANILEKYNKKNPFITNKDYSLNITKFAKDFMSLVNLGLK